MFRLSFVGVVAAGLAMSAAWAAEPVSIRSNTSGELAELCATNPRAPAADAKINFCHGFAQGALNTERKRAEENKLFCFPQNAPSRAIIMNEFANWVRANPDRRNLPSIEGLFRFFGERFPCK